MPAINADVDVDTFREHGFGVLTNAFDPRALRSEVAGALDEAASTAWDASVVSGTIRVAYAPLMNARTPHSLALLDALEVVARALLGGDVLPTRAKGVRYVGSTPWHRDSERPRIASVGFAAYLGALTATTGALRVVPRSHRGTSTDDDGAVALETTPGDIIAFDEHLLHASEGGAVRLQWRVDFLRDDDADELARYFEAIFPRDAPPPPYDAERFPSYGADWLHSGRACVDRLRALGVYDLAARR